MKNLSNLDAFKLEKSQMNVINGGGSYQCTHYYNDGSGHTYTEEVKSDYDADETGNIMSDSHAHLVLCE